MPQGLRARNHHCFYMILLISAMLSTSHGSAASQSRKYGNHKIIFQTLKIHETFIPQHIRFVNGDPGSAKIRSFEISSKPVICSRNPWFLRPGPDIFGAGINESCCHFHRFFMKLLYTFASITFDLITFRTKPIYVG